MTWIHEHESWPDFTWDNDLLAPKLARVRNLAGLLIGRMEGLGFALKQEAGMRTLINDVVKSSAIEGEILDTEEVRSSIARKLGIEVGGLTPSSRDVDGVVEMMLDATQRYNVPLTKARLFDWHAALFPTGRSGLQQITVGAWRPPSSGAMQVVSGAVGKEKVHFEAPAATQLADEMAAFLTWFEKEDRSLDPVLKAGIAHFWFVTVHPFEDGNGRIGRAIADMALARADKGSHRFYSMSAQIEAERKAYYDHLEQQQRTTPDITSWLDWFLGCLERSITASEKALAAVLFKARLWDRINENPVNERQRKILNRMMDGFKGHMNTSKYAKMAKCSPDTALRDIQDLVVRNILIKNPGGGRSTSYRLPVPEEIES